MTLPHYAAIQLTEANLPLITVINGGIEPLIHEDPISHENDYFIFEIESSETTCRHDILSARTFRALKKSAEDRGVTVTVYTTET